MSDPMSFDDRLEDAFDRYVAAGAPAAIDARALVADLATMPRRRRPDLALARPRGLRLGLALGLIALLLAAAVAVVGSRLLDVPPIGGGGRLLVSYPVGPGALVTMNRRDVSVRPVTVSGCPIVAGNANAEISDVRFVGIRYLGFDGGASSPIRKDYAGGERWAEDYRTLAMLDFTDGVVRFVRVEGGDVEHPVITTVPIDLTGVPDDGTGLREFDGAFSPDGSQFLVKTWANEGGTSRLILLQVKGGASRVLATIGAGPNDLFGTISWTRDASAAGVIGVHDGLRQLALVSMAGDVRWLGRPADARGDDDLALPPYAAGNSLIAAWVNGALQLVDLRTGAWTRTPVTGSLGGSEFALSPDGRAIATVGGTTLTRFDVATGDMTVRQLGGYIFAWSPDRSAIAVLVPASDEQSAEIRVLDPWSDAAPTLIATVPGEKTNNRPVTDPAPCIQWLPEADQ